MFDQTELLPKTELDEAHAVLSKLLADQEKAETAIDNAEKKHSEITLLVSKQRHVIKRLQSMMPPADSVVDGHAAEETEDADFEPIAEIEGDVLDPITGEVVSKTHTGDEVSQTPHVFVVWPHCNDAVRTEIGAHTTYGELVADYCSVALEDGKVEDFNVVSEHGSIRPLNKAIVPPDYGREFRIQEKATEAELAEHEALKDRETAA